MKMLVKCFRHAVLRGFYKFLNYKIPIYYVFMSTAAYRKKYTLHTYLNLKSFKSLYLPTTYRNIHPGVGKLLIITSHNYSYCKAVSRKKHALRFKENLIFSNDHINYKLIL